MRRRRNPRGLDPAAKVLIVTGVALAAMIGVILLVNRNSAASTPTIDLKTGKLPPISP